MQLRGIDFGPVWGASGVQGFYGEGYTYHRYLRPLGLTFRDLTFVAKTVTWESRVGNMPLVENLFVPRDTFPDCIKVYPLRGMALNAVGLSNHGAQAHLSFHFQGRKHWPQWMSKNTPRWQARRKPFFLSYAMTESSPEDHLPALGNFLHVLGKELFSFPHLRETVGLQLNLSCPNTEHGIELLEEEGIKALDMVRVSGISIPVVLKLSVTTPVTTAVKLALHPACNAIIVSNTLKWGEIPEKINWKKLFGTDISPLAHFGGGGLSGRPLLPLLLEWLEEAKRVGFPKPINAGGGILGPKDVDEVFGRGAQGISLGSIVMLRPWRMTKTIARAHVLARQHARKRGR